MLWLVVVLSDRRVKCANTSDMIEAVVFLFNRAKPVGKNA